ncbi:olfactory receptor and adenosine receptor [Holotrichia oblita]|uniref:Olfactory receptor and adenosine receptor n=1 Tax=Holotrichia oblita TaxID=644536 RepID=A0ACB9T5W8_HOLOL|nr:olfactory receptor and adenosine receptor [Holotrichia oblita]
MIIYHFFPVIIGICWVAGFIIGFLPLMGWHNADSPEANRECYFLKVVDMNYLVFLYFGTIITPALILAAFYAHIYRVVLKQLRQIVTISPRHGRTSAGRSGNGGTMLRMLGAAQKREVKATQNLSIIVLFFMICWIPLYTVNCVIAFCSNCVINETFMFLCIILSHANSAGNPILYAYHLKDFREALKNFLYSLIGKNQGLSTNRTSIVSNLNNCAHYKHYSLRESRLIHASQNRRYIESPIYFKRATKSMSLPSSPQLIEIVPSSLNLTAVSNNSGANKREIWRISEAGVGEDSSNVQNDSSNSNSNASSPFHKIPSSSSSVKNGSYLNDVNYDEDDDVFLDDTLPITDITVLPTITKQNKHSDSDIRQRFHAKREYSRAKCDYSLSNSSPQLSQSLFLIENEVRELEKCDSKTVCIYNVKDKNASNGRKRLKLSLSDISSPVRSARVSPLKVVSDFLWNSTANKQPRSLSLSEDSNASGQSKKNGLIKGDDKHSIDY